MSIAKFEASLASGIHQQLGLLAGEWEGTAKVWFEPHTVEDESPISGTMKSILGGRFILHEYHGSFKGKPISGIAMIGYSISTGAYQCAWADSYHMGTGIMFSEGGESDKLLSVLGHYGGPDIPELWGWRTEIEMPANNRIIITAYNITPKGESMKATETIYSRK